MHRASRWAQPEGINLTPLLDVIFNLIFFFLLATSVKTEDLLNITLPESTQAEQVASDKKALTISITREDKIVVRGEEVAPDELTALLAQLFQDEEYSGVIVRADGEASMQAGTHVLSSLTELGITQSHLDVSARRPEAAPAAPSETIPGIP